ncbi:MAG: hypothetical protein AAB863_04110 [Patescibacteria group bacterium]
MLSQEAIQKILGINEYVPLEPEEMAKELTVTFYPHHKHKVSKNILDFAEKFRTALVNLGVKIIPYEESLARLPLKRLFKIYFYSILGQIPKGLKKSGRKIRKGISVITLGEGIAGDLAMDNTMGFAKNSVITILDMPEGIDTDTEFHKHFDTAMNLFAYHMTNIAIIVDDKKWIPYNFNASHPVYSIDENLEHHILRGVIPKIAAPIKPPRLFEFTMLKEQFDPDDDYYKEFVEDFIESGAMLEKTGLYPPGKLLDDLPFRNDFYRWIGKIHLDQRNGMSYGFLARQLPPHLSAIYTIEEAKEIFKGKINEEKDFFTDGEKIFILLNTAKGEFCMQIPETWVMTQKSGSKKTDMNPNKDIVKIGLVNGKMLMQVPKGLKITPDYKPSFDTKAILAHAVGNAIIGSLLKYLKPDSEFVSAIENNGVAIAHWHGYINPETIPHGWHVHGQENVPVACSTPQSAIYALVGKINAFTNCLIKDEKYLGDVHIEPHHGTNICFTSLRKLGSFLSHRQDVSKLGNHYFNFYKK